MKKESNNRTDKSTKKVQLPLEARVHLYPSSTRMLEELLSAAGGHVAQNKIVHIAISRLYDDVRNGRLKTLVIEDRIEFNF